MKMKVGYKKAMGIIYIIIGVVFSCLYLLIAAGGGKGGITLLTAAFCLIMFGILFLRRTYFTINDDSLVLEAILGPAKTTYKFETIKQIEIDKNKVYLSRNGKRQLIQISQWMAEKSDWEAFLQKINSAS
jgi:hypothetical protein